MRIPHHDDLDENVINTSSLVDVMFILIIFFLVTMSFNEEERDIMVNLPETDTTLSSAVKAMVINVRSDGSYYLGPKRVNLAQIQSELTKALEGNPEQKVLIRGDQNALHGNVAAAVSACKNSGIRDANIGYVSKTR
jgi:biopolymer transport protein ExbD